LLGLLDHIACRQPRAIAISPIRSVDRRKHDFGANLAYAGQIVLEDALLRGHLRAHFHVLQTASAADAKMHASWRDAGRRRAKNAGCFRQLVVRLALVGGVFDEFARKRTGDENGLALDTRYPAAFLIKRLYLRNARGGLSPHLQTSSRQEIAASDSPPIPTASPAPARTRVDTAHCRAR